MVNLRRRSMLELPSGGGGEIVIPDSYQRVEWVGYEGTGQSGGPYLETGDVISARSQMEGYEVYINAYSAPSISTSNGMINPIVGWGSNAGLYFGTCRVSSSSILIGFGANISQTFDSSISYTEKHSYHIYWENGAGYADCDGETCSRAYTESSGTYYLRIGTGIWSSQHSGQYKIYGDIRVLKDGVLIHHYVPCYRKSGGAIGFYDVVAETFKTKLGTGEFTKGADV